MEYPSNSQKRKQPEPEPKVIQQVVTGEVIRKKPSLGKRFKETFIGGDAQSVWMYVAYDILIPAVKDTLSDAVSMGIERMLFGEGRSPSRRGRASSPYQPGRVNYSSFSRPSSTPANRYQKEESRPMSRRARGSHNFDEIVLETRAEAVEVVDRLIDLIDQYNVASVSDLYELLGVTSDFPDEKFGWYDLRAAKVSRTREGYLLDLPRPEVLE
jgi:hypothetical protein